MFTRNATLRSLALAAGILSSAGAASAQNASWQTQIDFTNTATGVPIAGSALTLTATGTYTFVVRAGLTNIVGIFQQGHVLGGLGTLSATATATGLQPGETLGINSATSRVAPFDFGPATSFGGALASSAQITGINATRDVNCGALSCARALWEWDTAANAPAPMPTQPTDSILGPYATRGLSSNADAFRFSVTVTTLNGPSIVINLAGQSGLIYQWNGQPAVAPTAASPSSRSFTGTLPTTPLLSYTPASLTLVRSICNPPVIVAQPSALSVNVGSPALFKVASSSSGITYQWRRNGVPLADNGRINGATTAMLGIFSPTSADAGTYDVIISNSPTCSATSSPVPLRVLCPVDADRNGLIQPADVGSFIADFFTALTSGGC